MKKISKHQTQKHQSNKPPNHQSTAKRRAQGTTVFE